MLLKEYEYGFRRTTKDSSAWRKRSSITEINTTAYHLKGSKDHVIK
jgi:hypothetical protein